MWWMDHSLLNCEVARMLWDEDLRRSRFAWVMTWRVVDHFTCWRGLWGNSLVAVIWNFYVSCCVVGLKSIWKVPVPSKVAFFTWTTALVKTFTADNIRKWGMFMLEWCFVCKKGGKSIDHLFLHCEVARQFYGLKFWIELVCVGLCCIKPKIVLQLLTCLFARGISSAPNK